MSFVEEICVVTSFVPLLINIARANQAGKRSLKNVGTIVDAGICLSDLYEV